MYDKQRFQLKKKTSKVKNSMTSYKKAAPEKFKRKDNCLLQMIHRCIPVYSHLRRSSELSTLKTNLRHLAKTVAIRQVVYLTNQLLNFLRCWYLEIVNTHFLWRIIDNSNAKLHENWRNFLRKWLRSRKNLNFILRIRQRAGHGSDDSTKS